MTTSWNIRMSIQDVKELKSVQISRNYINKLQVNISINFLIFIVMKNQNNVFLEVISSSPLKISSRVWTATTKTKYADKFLA